MRRPAPPLVGAVAAALLGSHAPWLPAALAQDPAPAGDARERDNEALLAEVRRVHGLTDAQTEAIRAVFSGSRQIGTGNPASTRHPMTEAECGDRIAGGPLAAPDPTFTAICGGPYMAPLYDPATEKPEDARVCIDQLEFPDIPCRYPLIWVRAGEAADLCEAMGKRLCDAHEWEGACEGRLAPPDYRFDLAGGKSPAEAQKAMRLAHNAAQTAHTWSYGDAYRPGVCGTGSRKSADCDGSDWTKCGSNTFPTGAFADCHSALGVYDLHGNAAEHMNLPLAPDQMAIAETGRLGVTEMKGSWFVFDQVYAHEDWCRWRAPYWHGGAVQAEDSHRNYHLGFRCCRTVGDDAPPPAVP